MSTLKNKNSLRTIEPKLCKVLRTMRLDQNLLVLIKKKACSLLPIPALQKENAAVIEEQSRAM